MDGSRSFEQWSVGMSRVMWIELKKGPIIIIIIIIIFIMLFLVYLVDLYNLAKEIYRILLIISKNDVQARKLNEPFGYLKINQKT